MQIAPGEIMMNGIIKSGRATFIWLYHFVPFLMRQFVERRGLQSAASLAYTTLLSIVPLIGVTFSFFINMPVFKEINDKIQGFIFDNFVPAFGDTVQEYLISFSMKASQLTLAGIIVLIIIALMLISTIDSALNQTWNVVARRKPLSRFLIYWAILTLGPILLGAGLYATSYILALPVLENVDSTLDIKRRLIALMPFITSALAFTLLYVVVPNCYVDRRHALIGGVVAALLFEIAKYGFGLYVKAVPTYELIYGALAIIPMFLIWIYLSWVIVLLGAQIAYALSVFRLGRKDRHANMLDWDFVDAFSIIAELWQAQQKGENLSSIQIRKRGVSIPHVAINEILEKLKDAYWVYRTSAGEWILLRDLNELTLLDLYRLLPSKLPDKVDKNADKRERQLENVIENISANLDETLSVPIAKLLREKTDPDSM